MVDAGDINALQDIFTNNFKLGVSGNETLIKSIKDAKSEGLRPQIYTHPLGTLGHSDGDPVLHAITDSILGACKMGDIGQKFSDKNIRYKNIFYYECITQTENEKCCQKKT